MPGVAAAVLIAVEFLGGAALMLGLLTRWVATLIAIDMTVAILLSRSKEDFSHPRGLNTN